MTKTPFEQRIAALLEENPGESITSLGTGPKLSSNTVRNWIKKSKDTGYPAEPAEKLRLFAAHWRKSLDWLLAPTPLGEEAAMAGVFGQDTLAMAREVCQALVELDDVSPDEARKAVFDVPQGRATSALRMYGEARRLLRRSSDSSRSGARPLGAFEQTIGNDAKKLRQGSQTGSPRNTRKSRD